MAVEKDQRTEERFPVGANSSCTFASPVIENFGPVKIKNVSLKGVGLILSQKVEPGSMLAVTVANAVKKFTKTGIVRVIHVTPQPGGTYVIGGDWATPLTYEELCNLIM
jgi:hypothetical protein